MSKYSISQKELVQHLKDQIAFLISSSISYDKGFEGEAKRLAANIRILVYDSTRCTAVLTQLRKMNILFYDSASTFDPKNQITSNCLTLMKLSRESGDELKGEYVAPLDNFPKSRSKDKKISFDRWWKRNLIYKDSAGSEFTRRGLVLTVADKEGGAHVDPKLDQTYANLSRFHSLAWKIRTTNGRVREFENSPVPPSIRQISHEILKTLKDGVLDLFGDKKSVLEMFQKYEEHCLKLGEGNSELRRE